MINIILADDHTIVLESLSTLLSSREKDIKVLAQAINGLQVIDLLKKQEASGEKTDVVVLDMNMPQMNGAATTLYIREHFPEVAILILTYHNEIEVIEEILEAGASGYVLKNKNVEELVKAIRAVAAGKHFYSSEVVDALVENVRSGKRKGQDKPIRKDGQEPGEDIQLTRREKDVLKHIAQGLTAAAIGEALFIAPTTVETHRKNLLNKTGCANSLELVRYAIKNGLD